jgi:hypothetical protein
VTGKRPNCSSAHAYPTKILPVFQSALKILKTTELINNTPNNPGISLVSKNWDIVVVKLGVEQFEQFEQLGSSNFSWRQL